DKSSLFTPFINQYRLDKLVQLQERLKEETSKIMSEDAIDDDIEEDELKSKVKKGKEEKIPTHILTLASWKTHKNIEQVAEERGFATSTIYTHLSKSIAEGELSIFDVVESAKVYELENLYVSTLQGLSLKE